MARFLVGLWGVAIALLVAGCGDDDGAAVGTATLERACDTVCGKLNECDLLFGMSASQCATNCRAAADDEVGDDGDGCEVTEGEANRCINAVDSAECSAFTTGNLPECDFCPDDEGQDAGIGIGLPDGGFSSAGDCDDLRTCCGELPSEFQDDCNTTADTGNDAACGLAVSTFRSTGMCS